MPALGHGHCDACPILWTATTSRGHTSVCDLWPCAIGHRCHTVSLATDARVGTCHGDPEQAWALAFARRPVHTRRAIAGLAFVAILTLVTVACVGPSDPPSILHLADLPADTTLRLPATRPHQPHRRKPELGHRHDDGRLRLPQQVDLTECGRPAAVTDVIQRPMCSREPTPVTTCPSWSRHARTASLH